VISHTHSRSSLMPPLPSPGRLLTAAACAAALLALAPAAGAQTCNPSTDANCNEEGSGPGGNPAPLISISPPTGLTVSQPELAVSIVMSDESDLANPTFRVLRNGTDVTGAFSYAKTPGGSGTPTTARATGFVRLAETGTTQLRAYVCDARNDQACSDAYATFTLALPGVDVSPDGTFSEPAGGAVPQQTFTVTNRGSSRATFALSASCRNENGDVLSCGSPGPVTLTAGESRNVAATYPLLYPGYVSVALTARQVGSEGVQDAGWVEVLVPGGTGTAQLLPTFTLAPMNAGGTIERGRCITVATALRGAYECGDLRVAHGLPAARTYNRAWAPTLLYNGQHAHPTPTVYADVTLQVNAAQPEWVDLTVMLAGGATHVARFDGKVFTPGVPRRVGVQWDGLKMATGLYKFYVQVTSHYVNNPAGGGVDSGYVAVVNRSGSAFGAGWWVAGWEQIVAAGPRMLWIGGDGSTRVYETLLAGQRWIARNPDGPADTLAYVAASGSTSAGYVRILPGGGRIEFDAAGRHVRTVNRLGQTTTFQVSGGRIDAIQAPVPAGGGTAPAWAFTYDSPDGNPRLRSVAATSPGAPARTVALGYSGTDRRVTGITDPDGQGVLFGYATGTYTRRINRQTDRRGTQVHYGYDGLGRMSSSRLQMNPTGANAALDPETKFLPAESRGVVLAGSTSTASVPAAAVYTRIDGPRPQAEVLDHTYLWLNRDGTLRRIRNPVGAETRIQYQDGRFPALATEVSSPTGVISRAWYDSLGHVVQSTEFGAYTPTESVTQTYGWDARCDRPLWVKPARADTIFYGYDTNNCNLLWQRQGRDPERQVDFAYFPGGHALAGMADSVRGPVDAAGRRAVERVTYAPAAT
jgi:YD repeat-containing protein